jgi:hypothetical protein
MNKEEKIKKYAEIIKPKCKNRIELAWKVAKKFNISPGTANHYLTLAGVKFRQNQPQRIFQFISDIIKEPKFSFEFDYLPSPYYKKCVELKMPIRQCVFYIKNDEKLKNVPAGKNPRVIVYYLESQKEIAYRKILNYFAINDRRLAFLQKALNVWRCQK